MEGRLDSQSQDSAYRRLIEIGIALSDEKNLDSLLEHILLEAKAMAQADGGTIYLATARETLEFSIVLNDTLKIAQGGVSGEPISLPDIQLFHDELTPNLSHIASSAAHRGSSIVVDDSRVNTEFDFSGTRNFDELLGYQSISFLTVPLMNLSDDCVGVLQLLNALDNAGNPIPFEASLVPLIEALASQASVAIENRRLLDEQEELKRQLESEVEARTEELREALTKLSEAHIILKELNTIDAVTGIRNRQYFDDVLDQEWRRAKRQGYEVSMLMLDIDHFKKVNDTYGHLAGDECLAAVAKEVDESFNRPSDVVARYGGEEFVVVLPYISHENALELAESLRQTIEQNEYQADGHSLKITLSIGVATVDPSKDQEVEPRELIGLADGMLYEAKSSGRNRVCSYVTKAATREG